MLAKMVEKEVDSVYQLAHVVNTILFRVKNEGIAISPMKLQKLTYFLYAEYLYSEHDCLFATRCEAWKYGPVIGNIYWAFKDCKDGNVKHTMVDADGKRRVIDVDSDRKFEICFDKMWLTYAAKTGIELAEITQKPSDAWYAAVMRRENFLQDQDIFAEMEQQQVFR